MRAQIAAALAVGVVYLPHEAVYGGLDVSVKMLQVSRATLGDGAPGDGSRDRRSCPPAYLFTPIVRPWIRFRWKMR